ncbi:ETC complex I subunit [Rhodopila sp.]|jgi:hypothetical protein|uniref:ETC complex I subunit n=1 Tax=Rhodopila sp. TaxID=2480087 RepID=UPI002BE1339E|nr:ETC complex I subunit [Rhodopila sp.]HVZ07309.1 ETC complex I subunit [Rhodopila sp.]
MRARIFQPPKNAMQSGWAKTHQWVLEFVPNSAKRPDALMGWAGGGDTQTQVRLTFDTREEAISYADTAGLTYEVEIPHHRKVKPKAYADNFRYGRLENWTH